MVRLIRVFVLLSMCTACGLISDDVDDFRLGFPEKDFTVDTADWGLGVSGTVPTFSCAGTGCNTFQTQLCGGGAACTADCDTSLNCQGHVNLTIWNNFDLQNSNPEYSMIDQNFRVRVETVTFRVTENDLTHDTPPLDVYMGPVTATSPSDTGVLYIGTIPSVPAMTTTERQLEMDAQGRANMEAFMTNFRSPFNVIVVGTVDIVAGDTVPMGHMVGKVTATAFADLI